LPIRVLIKKATFEKIQDCPADLKKRITDALKELESSWPMTRLDIKKLKGYEGHYRIRVGSYRVLFFYESGSAIVYDVSSRKDVYK